MLALHVNHTGSFLHSKLAPLGPAWFCANPAVIHVGDRTQVYNLSTLAAIFAVSWMPLLPIPMTATFFPCNLMLVS